MGVLGTSLSPVKELCTFNLSSCQPQVRDFKLNFSSRGFHDFNFNLTIQVHLIAYEIISK